MAWHCRAAWLLLLLQDWLFISYKRVDGVEYALLLATFGLVLAAGLEAGIAGAFCWRRCTLHTGAPVLSRRARCVRWPVRKDAWGS